MPSILSRRIGTSGGVVLIVTLVAVGLGLMVFVGPVAATGDATDDDPRQIGAADLTVQNEEFVLEDVRLNGPGLPDVEIDERTYEIERATFTADGVSFTFQGTPYEVGDLTVAVEDVSFTLRNISLSDTV